jgi:hypothetical protein
MLATVVGLRSHQSVGALPHRGRQQVRVHDMRSLRRQFGKEETNGSQNDSLKAQRQRYSTRLT